MKSQSKNTILTLANAVVLTTDIVKEIMGSEVSNSLNGSRLSRDALGSLVCSKIHSKFSRYTNAEVTK